MESIPAMNGRLSIPAGIAQLPQFSLVFGKD
jgi:hypothetical protein